MKPKFVVTAGPTREFIDPVRFLSNPSTGRMGFAVARAAAEAGYRTTLVAGPSTLRTPPGVERVDVLSALDMLDASLAAVSAAGGPCIFVSAAAVCDWRPATCSRQKTKKGSSSSKTLRLVRNPDILKTLSLARSRGELRQLKLVGFAAETGEPSAEAFRKCREKGLEFTVANDVTLKGAGFAVNTNKASIAFADGTLEEMGIMSKLELARRIVALALQ